MDFTNTLEAFYSPLPVYVEDVTGTYDAPERAGIWTWGEPVRREKPILAIVLQLTYQQLDLLNEGNVSAGGIAVHTQTDLYFTDVEADGVEGDVQSYIVYQGYRFRVIGTGFISAPFSLVGNANFKNYVALRALDAFS